jgi:hypothetical protein
VPSGLVSAITIALVAAGIVGRLVLQPKVSE